MQSVVIGLEARSGYRFRDCGWNGKNNTETTGKMIQLILHGSPFFHVNMAIDAFGEKKNDGNPLW